MLIGKETYFDWGNIVTTVTKYGPFIITTTFHYKPFGFFYIKIKPTSTQIHRALLNRFFVFVKKQIKEKKE